MFLGGREVQTLVEFVSLPSPHCGAAQGDMGNSRQRGGDPSPDGQGGAEPADCLNRFLTVTARSTFLIPIASILATFLPNYTRSFPLSLESRDSCTLGPVLDCILMAFSKYSRAKSS